MRFAPAIFRDSSASHVELRNIGDEPEGAKEQTLPLPKNDKKDKEASAQVLQFNTGEPIYAATPGLLACTIISKITPGFPTESGESGRENDRDGSVGSNLAVSAATSQQIGDLLAKG